MIAYQDNKVCPRKRHQCLSLLAAPFDSRWLSAVTHSITCRQSQYNSGAIPRVIPVRTKNLPRKRGVRRKSRLQNELDSKRHLNYNEVSPASIGQGGVFAPLSAIRAARP